MIVFLVLVTIILVDIAYILPPMTSYFLIFVARARIFACIYACISAYTHAYPHIRVCIYISLRPTYFIYSLVFVPIWVFLPSYLCRSAAILCGLLYAYMCIHCLPMLDSPSDLSFRVPPVLIARKQLWFFFYRVYMPILSRVLDVFCVLIFCSRLVYTPVLRHICARPARCGQNVHKTPQNSCIHVRDLL